MALLDTLINTFFSPLRPLFDKLVSGFQHLKNIGSDIEKLVTTIENEVEAWRKFKANPKFANRVISVPVAFDKTKALIQGIPDSWRSAVDLFRQLKSKVDTTGSVDEAEAEEFTRDLESGKGISGLLRRAPGLLKIAEKFFGVIALAVDALETISSAISDVQTIVDETARIRSEIEDLDSLFLSQKNKRRVEKLADGSTIKIRVGNLHK